jgi:hypothetical protein
MNSSSTSGPAPKIDFQRTPVGSSFVNIWEGDKLLLGFSERGVSSEDLRKHFAAYSFFQPQQIHSATILNDSLNTTDSFGDGVLLRQRRIMAVIQTADCVPLFFYSIDFDRAGILHVGWRGLLLGIEAKLLSMLEEQGSAADRRRFILGPAIEQNCYPVGSELLAAFKEKFYANAIFAPGHEGKYFLNLKKGITMSLQHRGVGQGHILDVSLCTYCEQDRFPSHRRKPGSKERMFSFIALK